MKLTLKKQIHIYSLDTSSFYTPQERHIYDAMLNLHQSEDTNKKEKINQLKSDLKQLFNDNAGIVRNLWTDDLRAKNVISVFDSVLS